MITILFKPSERTSVNQQTNFFFSFLLWLKSMVEPHNEESTFLGGMNLGTVGLGY
jgi:hypothetical protein